MFADNKHLGQFDLVGIPSAPRGVPQIDVAFDIDANGILNVTAKDLGTAKEQSMRITAPNKLDSAEVERMRKQAEEFAEVDNKRKDEIETVNNADTLVYQSEKQLAELEGKVSEKEVKNVKDRIAELKALLSAPAKDIAKIKAKVEECNKVLHVAATELYQKAQKQGGEGKTGAKEETIKGEKA